MANNSKGQNCVTRDEGIVVSNDKSFPTFFTQMKLETFAVQKCHFESQNHKIWLWHAIFIDLCKKQSYLLQYPFHNGSSYFILQKKNLNSIVLAPFALKLEISRHSSVGWKAFCPLRLPELSSSSHLPNKRGNATGNWVPRVSHLWGHDITSHVLYSAIRLLVVNGLLKQLQTSAP